MEKNQFTNIEKPKFNDKMRETGILLEISINIIENKKQILFLINQTVIG